MRLYSFAITPNNRKVEAFIRHFDLDIDIQQVKFKDRETHSPAFLALNPMGKVPLLTDGDFNLWESNAILCYLATKFPQTAALPADARGRADVDRWLHWQSSHLASTIFALKTGAETDASAVTALLKVLQQQLAGREYLLGELTVADFAVSAYLMSKFARQFDYSACPDVLAWVDRMAGLKGFVASQVKMA